MPDQRETRTAPLGLRLMPSVREALSQAARDDSRSVASLCEKILTEWLRAKGYLSKGAA
jgi:hypothetical protein